MIKDALIKLSASTHFDDIQLFSSVHVVCFFGAPNRGIENHALLQVYGEKRPGQVIRDLGAGSSVLNALNESWIEISKKVKIVSCFELRVTPTVRLMQDDPDGFPQRDGPLALMVSRDSACFYTENETRIPIDLNHSMIAKLTNEPGSAYHSIARTIKAQVQDALKQQELYLQRETPRAALTSRSLSSHGSTLLRYKHLKALGENSCQGSNAGDILASYGLFLATDGEWITENSNTFCRTLLENEQETQTGTLFQDALFKSTCDNFRKKSEAKLIRDMTPLIVPSAEILFLRGASRLGVLIEGVCEIWNTSIPIIRTLPRPSYSLGFTQEAFSDDQLRKLEPFAGELVEESFFKVTDSILFPFLTCEVKCGDLGLDIADSRNMESSSMAVRGLVELFKLVCREKELNHEILSFSVSHDASKVRIYGHYAVTNGPRTSYHRHALRKFDIMALGGKDKWSAYQFTRNLYDMWAPLHLQRIRTAIDELEFSTSL
ncbi:hypothetical protein NW764_009857 [Fusarium oxysporum]|nr:hypothetical protein NW764_009857 [Fusarium oxysporum]